jgi:tape measure domain-containing protein
VVETTRRLGDVAGATGANLGELATAYGQVVAKGRLQGEELLQFQERGVALADELRKMYGLTREEFTKALESGRISSEAVTVALQRLTDAGGKYAGGAIAQSDTLNGKLSTLLDGVTTLSQTIGQLLEPALKGVLSVAITAVGAVETAIRALVEGFQTAYRESDLFRGAINGLIGALTTLAALQVFSAFIAGARAAITITGTLIKALKALTAANLLAGIAGFFKSKPGLIAALVAGLGVGIDAAFNDGQIVKGIASGLDNALSAVFDKLGASVPSLAGLPQLGSAGAVPDLIAERGAAERAAREREQAANKAEAAAKRAAALQERRMELERKGGQMVVGLQDKLDGLSQAYANVGATGVQALQGRLSQALSSNSQEVRKLTLDYVEFVREVQKLGGEVTPETTAKFRSLIDQIGEGGEKLANAEFVQGLKELLPAVQDYDQQIAEGRIQLENRKRGVEGLTEAQKLQNQIDLLGLEILAAQNPALAEHIRLLKERAAALDEVKKALDNNDKSFSEQIQGKLQAYYNQVKDLGSAIGDSIVNTFQGLEDKLTEFVTTGKANFADLARSILSDLARIAIRAAIIKPLVGAVGGIFPGFSFATGGIMTGNGPVPLKKYANGGIARSPQLALFGEGSQPEAFVPLPDGRRIPVAMQGGGGTSVVVNVDAKGTDVQGDDQRGQQLGRVIAAAVQNELVKQKRPGGLLAA